MALRLFVDKCSNLPKLDKSGECDPYIDFKFRNQKKTTDVISSNSNPVYGKEFIFHLNDQPLNLGESMDVVVMDRERFGKNRLIGTAKANLKTVFQKLTCSFHLRLTLSSSLKVTEPAFVDFKINYEGAPDAENKKLENEENIDGSMMEVEESGEDQNEDDKVIPKKSLKTAKRKHKNLMLDTKPRDFQIRVKIVCARSLRGENMNTLCRVTFNRKHKQTRIQRATSSPRWNEIFFFNTKISPKELMTEIIEFNVYKSLKIRSDPLIGSFKCDMGLIYDSPSHAIINKWLLLHLPDSELSSTTGFLKVCVAIMGAGDKPPHFEEDKESNDVESNLLKSLGATLQQKTFIVNIYEAEDLPKMDLSAISAVKNFFGVSDSNDLVDPFVITSFAGNSLKSSILTKTDHPQFMESFRINFMIPTLCENLKMTLMDWDKLNQNDLIGVANLSISEISASGENGFLPTFGPSYVNVYGSHREMEILTNDYDDANMGLVEGFGYRGRIFMELKTIPYSNTLPDVDSIGSTTKLTIDKFKKRRLYVLYGMIQNAGMLGEYDGMVMFELSIGLYGNIFDRKSEPTSSVTQPMSPIFDGNYYYYIPFGPDKPGMRIECQWEDIIFRIENINQLRYYKIKLDKYIAFIQNMLDQNADYKNVASVIIKAIEDIISDLKHPLVPLDCKNNITTLDRKLNEMRYRTIEEIIQNLSEQYKTATEVTKLLEEFETIKETLNQLINDPQMSIPDVIVWMICNQERIGYARINPCDIFYSKNSMRTGRQCWKRVTFDLKEPQKNNSKVGKIVGKLQMFLWFGLKNEESRWKDSVDKDMQIQTYAETYENQTAIPGTAKWSDMCVSRPHFSDITGKIKLPKDIFKCPEGWSWDEDWFVSPNTLFSDVIKQKNITEEIYENESRVPGMSWKKAKVLYTTSFGDPTDIEIELEENWNWENDWTVDLKRAVDEYGWEYSTFDGQLTGYSPVEKLHHTCRRRRLIRTRMYKLRDLSVGSGVKKYDKDEGWEYAALFNTKFHKVNRKMDLVRRRRWMRRMVCDKEVTPCMFVFDNSDDSKTRALIAPTINFGIKTVHKLQLRAYIFQGRDLLARDNNSLSDPYLLVVCNNQSQKTMSIKKTLSPTWDQSLIFHEITLYETIESLKENLVEVNIQVFDDDMIGVDEYMGRCPPIKPVVKLPNSPSTCSLNWYPVYYRGEQHGEILAAFELINTQGKIYPLPPRKSENIYSIPNEIRPVLENCTINIMALGLRDLKSYQLLPVESPSCEIEIGGEIVETGRIAKISKNSNFRDPMLTIKTNIPKNPMYCPPINIRVRDNREFGWKPVVGLCSISNLEKYRKSSNKSKTFLDFVFSKKRNTMMQSLSPPSNENFVIDDDPTTNLLKSHARSLIDDSLNLQSAKKLQTEIDWWSKFYASLGDEEKYGKYLQRGFDKIKIYDQPLETVPEFNGFHDFCDTFNLHRGKTAIEEDDVVGQFKGYFQILPADSKESSSMSIPSLSNDECTVRVYVVKAVDLKPIDASGYSDPYLSLKIGSKTMETKNNYIPNTLNPYFAHMFEFKTNISRNKNLSLSVMDYDIHSRDDLIGETIIDLEDRFLTKYRATCGISSNYYIDGPNLWRDSVKPKQILSEVCLRNNFPSPVYFDRSLKIGDKCYFLEDFEILNKTSEYLGEASERLALHILNAMPLVKEHVETRPLYNSIQPELEQGRIMLWVDIFPLSLGLPGPPIDISLRKPKKYELRVIIWNTSDVILTEKTVIGREMMSDIYVKGWINEINSAQKTDIHYRSLDGEGNFNWRFLFQFDYMDAEGEMVINKKEHFWSLDKTEHRCKPQLLLQIWDNDKFSSDDFIGMIDLPLDALPKPASSRKSCGLDFYNETRTTQSLFEHKRIKGFWPCYNLKESKPILAGKIEMELELLTEEEALEKPAGLGRSNPNLNPKLPEPNRPATSFLWFTSPFKSFRYIIWRNYKWHIITGLVILFIVGFIFLIIYAIPGATIDKLIK